jgi:hypothetical protein
MGERLGKYALANAKFESAVESFDQKQCRGRLWREEAARVKLKQEPKPVGILLLYYIRNSWVKNQLFAARCTSFSLSRTPRGKGAWVHAALEKYV